MKYQHLNKLSLANPIVKFCLIWGGALFVSWLATFIQHYDELGTPSGDAAMLNALVFGFQVGCGLVILWALKKAIEPSGKLPSQRLQEEFDSQHPDRAKKEEPPVPVVPPPNEDNPYSYR